MRQLITAVARGMRDSYQILGDWVCSFGLLTVNSDLSWHRHGLHVRHGVVKGHRLLIQSFCAHIHPFPNFRHCRPSDKPHVTYRLAHVSRCPPFWNNFPQFFLFPVASRRRFGIIRAVGAGRASGENDLLSDFSKPHDKQEASGQSVKINGEYILSRRSIVRMIATITAALMSLYAAATETAGCQ